MFKKNKLMSLTNLVKLLVVIEMARSINGEDDA